MCVCVCVCVCVRVVYYVEFHLYRPSHTPQTPPDIDVLREQWRDVFIITAEVNVFGLIVFMVAGSAKLQSWAAVRVDNDATKHDP